MTGSTRRDGMFLENATVTVLGPCGTVSAKLQIG
jgi:hypothetical protein